MWAVFWAVLFGITGAVTGFVISILKAKNTALKIEIKSLLNDSRSLVDKENRNRDDIYFHIDNNMNISFMNETTCSFFKIGKNDWLHLSVLGHIIEENRANQVYLNAAFNRVKRNPSTINENIVVKMPTGKGRVMRIRIRPILDEVLNCVGMSVVLKDMQEAEILQERLNKLKNRDTLSKDILNEKALFVKTDKDFSRCRRYNYPFSLIVIEVRDIYEFICKGIDFERGDKLFINCAEICLKNGFKNSYVGRFNKTKFAIVLPNVSREQAADAAENLYYPMIKMIQSLGVDKYNAEMFVVSYSNRKNFNDSADALLGRINAHIERALKNKDYGIKASDKNYKLFND